MRFGPGQPHRLYAPGEPDWIGSDGTRLGWLLRDCLFLREGEDTIMVKLPDWGNTVAAGPSAWVVSLDDGFVVVDPHAGEVTSALLDERDPVATLPGADVAIVVDIPVNRLLRLCDGKPIPLPDGALRARWLAPFEVGVGAAWIDGDTLYRLGPTRISALGRASGAEGLRVGPHGAVVVQLPDATLVAAPNGLAMRVEQRLLAASARFSADGLRAMLTGEEGVVLLDLGEGKVLRGWDGDLVPAGFVGDRAVRLDGSGDLFDDEENLVGEGFTGAAPSCAGGVLAGPGGRVWRLADGVVLGRVSGVTATDGTLVAQIGQDVQIGPPGGRAHRFPHGFCEDDPVEVARIEGDELIVVTVDGEAAGFSLEGEVRWRRREPAPTATQVESELPVDGSTESAMGTWFWGEEGVLVLRGR